MVCGTAFGYEPVICPAASVQMQPSVYPSLTDMINLVFAGLSPESLYIKSLNSSDKSVSEK